MTDLKRIIEVDVEVAKSIKGGAISCNCDCYGSCSCGSKDNYYSDDGRSNRQTYNSKGQYTSSYDNARNQ
ncbi:MAG: hypothetical protein H6Q71_401 [Firmicutes bacterium]|nr:hypothetical protein [Bacillota bacterium]